MVLLRRLIQVLTGFSLAVSALVPASTPAAGAVVLSFRVAIDPHSHFGEQGLDVDLDELGKSRARGKQRPSRVLLTRANDWDRRAEAVGRDLWKANHFASSLCSRAVVPEF